MNQYTSISTLGSFDILVRSPNAVGVSVNGVSTSIAGQGDFYRAQAVASNTNGAWVGLDITSPPGTAPHVTGHRWLSSASYAPQYDDDGNLLNDGRWANTWDAENRLITQTTTTLAAAAGVPHCKIENTYDWQSRRIQKQVSTSTNGTTWTLASEERFVCNGWNQLAVSAITDPQSTIYYPSYDGNGNIIAWTATNGYTLQRIDYDPFGYIVTKEGVSGFVAPLWGFSTKYQDKETGLLYYGYRFYDPVTGKWPSRDPIGEEGGVNLYGFVGNDGVNWWDYLGMLNRDSEATVKMAEEQARKCEIGPDTVEIVRKGAYSGHSDFFNTHQITAGGDFNWSKEEEDKPAAPGNMGRHFREREANFDAARKAIVACDPDLFQREMHGVQDYLSHIAKGFTANTGHKIRGVIWKGKGRNGYTRIGDYYISPDLDNGAWASAQKDTKTLLKEWKAQCCVLKSGGKLGFGASKSWAKRSDVKAPKCCEDWKKEEWDE